MPDYKLACGARLPGDTHDYLCHYAKDHGGLHSCYCGVRWDAAGRITVKKTPRRR